MLGADTTDVLDSFVLISFTCAMVSEKVIGFSVAVKDGSVVCVDSSGLELGDY